MRVQVICLALGVTAASTTVAAQDDSYDCVSVAHTNMGWSVSRKTYSGVAISKVEKPAVVKLSEMRSDRPLMTGQSVARLQRLGSDGTTTWYAERAPAGTIIQWTFFAHQKATDAAPTAVLISSKSYDLFGGPVNFTDVYSCRPNQPRGR